MDWLRCKPAMNPLQRNLDQSHNLVRPTDGMELKARTSSLVSRGWISRERNPVTGGVFLLTSFLIERHQAICRSAHTLKHSSVSLTIADLQPITFQFEGAWLFGASVIGVQATVDVMRDDMLHFVHGV